MKTLIQNCFLCSAPGHSVDILIEEGKIAEIETEIPAGGAEVIDAKGLTAAPGLVDMHVHFREPGFEYKEDMLSGGRAAAAGGITSVAVMPNTSPVCDTPERVREVWKKAVDAAVRVYPVASMTMGLAGETLTDFEALRKAGAIAVSDDGRPVESGEKMKEVFLRAQETGVLPICHSEDLTISKNGIINEGVYSVRHQVTGIPAEAESAMIKRDIALAQETGCRVHIAHVSTRQSVEIIQSAKKRGVKVSAETCPHYFSLTEELLERKDADFRMNPPLRTEADRQAIIRGLCEGVIDVIATDHAPHAPFEKAVFEKAPNGIIGLETSLAAGITFLVEKRFFTLAQLIDKMSAIPAALLGIPGGTLAKGAPADLILFDPSRVWTADPGAMVSKSRNTAFKGMRLMGKVRKTFVGGRLVYSSEQ